MNNGKIRILVTGATGTVGSEVVSDWHQYPRPRIITITALEQQFMAKIKLINLSNMLIRELKLLIWIILSQKPSLML